MEEAMPDYLAELIEDAPARMIRESYECSIENDLVQYLEEIYPNGCPILPEND